MKTIHDLDVSLTPYLLRLRAINDALRLIQRGPSEPPRERPDLSLSGVGHAYLSHSSPMDSTDPRYAEVSLALDIARFLLDEELDDEEDDDDA